MNLINYKRLYVDFINEQQHTLSNHEKLRLVIKVNRILIEPFSFKQLYKINKMIRDSLKNKNDKVRSKTVNVYDRSYILEVLLYQKELGLSDRAVSLEFKLSRNTLASWKKWFENYESEVFQLY